MYMELTDSIKIEVYRDSVHGIAVIPHVQLFETDDITRLLASLNDGIISISEDGENEGYSVGDSARTTTIPTNHSKDEGEQLQLIISNGRLEIVLTEYDDSSADNLDTIGGPVTVRSGVQCNFRYDGEISGMDAVERAKRVLRDFYTVKTL